jgi:uncharacterized protein YrrD
MLAGVDLGPPISYMVLAKGAGVFSSDGSRVGTVAHVLADEAQDVFDGIVIQETIGPGGHRFVDAGQVAAIHEGGVLLGLDAGQAAQLPEPSANPAVMREDPAAPASSALGDKLRRAWDYISGNY